LIKLLPKKKGNEIELQASVLLLRTQACEQREQPG
jgi:hypothetical protein